MLSISVITPTYNKAHFLDLTLASYLHQTHKEFELVLVDDGSTDNTREVVERYRGLLNIRYIHQPNQGRSAARNVGLREATGDIIVFADDDRLAVPEFIAAHARGFSSPADNLLIVGRQAGFVSWWEPRPEFESRMAPLRQRHPQLAKQLTGKKKVPLVSASDIRERFSEMIEKFSIDEPWWGICQSVIQEFSGNINTFRLGWMIGTTGNMSAPRQRVVEVGAFDEGFSQWGMEDTDLSFRLCQAGARIVVSEEALSFHQIHSRSPTWNEDWQRNFSRFWAKYDSVQIPLLYLFIKQHLTARQANTIAHECERLVQEGRPVLVDELKRVYRLAALALQPVTSVELTELDAAEQPGKQAPR